MVKNFSRPSPTLYSSHNDLRRAIITTIDILNDKDTDLAKDPEGFMSIDEVCTRLREIHPDLTYVNRNHIVELFFKDRDRKIMISGLDKVKYKEVRYVQPPAELYFGTIDVLVGKMKKFGIHSESKGYLKLYSDPELAMEMALKFRVRDTDVVKVLSIDAAAAFSDGLKFSTYKDNEFIVVRLDRKYIIGEVDLTQ